MQKVFARETYEQDEYFVATAFEEIKDKLYFDPSIDEDDYCQVGRMALEKAKANYRDNKCKWMTYAMRVIKNAMFDVSKREDARKRSTGEDTVSLNVIADKEQEVQYKLVTGDISISLNVITLLNDYIKRSSVSNNKKCAIKSFILEAEDPTLTAKHIAEMLEIEYGTLRRARHDVKNELREYLSSVLK